MNLSSCGVQFISEFEGYSSTAYWDNLGSVWTIGFGTTGPHAFQGATCTREQALDWLSEEVTQKDAPAIHNLGYTFTQWQYDSLCSFCYNLGPGILNPGRSIRTALDSGDWTTVPAAMRQYDKAGNPPKPVGGLTRRRGREAAMFANADYGFSCVPDVPHTLEFYYTEDNDD